MNPSVTGKQNNNMIVVRKTHYDFNITSVVGVFSFIVKNDKWDTLELWNKNYQRT